MDFCALTSVSPGFTVDTTATSLSQAIPNGADGKRARYCRLQATGYCYVKLGVAPLTATDSDLLLSPNEALIVATRQFDSFACLQETPGAKLNVVPLEA